MPSRSLRVGSRRAVALGAAANTLGPLSSFFFVVVVSRVLGAADRGLVAAASVPIVIATAAWTLGLPESITKFGAQAPARAGRYAQLSLVLLTVTATPLALALAFGGQFFDMGSNDVRHVVTWSAAALIPSLALWPLRGLAQARGEWVRLAVDKLSVAAVRVIAAVVLLACSQLTVASAAWALILSPLAGGLAHVRRRSDRQPEPCISRDETRPFLRFGLSVWLGSITGILATRLDQLIMSSIASPRDLGLYAAAANVGEISLFAMAALSTVLLAVESASSDDSRVARVIRVTTAGQVVLAAIAVPTARWWLPALFGPEFRDAVPSAAILIIASAILAPASVAGAALTARGRPLVRSLALTLMVVVNVPLVLVLVPAYGATGAAVSTLVANAIFYAVAIPSVKRVTGVRFFDLIVPRRQDLAWVFGRPRHPNCPANEGRGS